MCKDDAVLHILLLLWITSVSKYHLGITLEDNILYILRFFPLENVIPYLVGTLTVILNIMGCRILHNRFTEYSRYEH
jgi:hypothetical protein